jgi:hypothetical protein
MQYITFMKGQIMDHSYELKRVAENKTDYTSDLCVKDLVHM